MTSLTSKSDRDGYEKCTAENSILPSQDLGVYTGGFVCGPYNREATHLL